MQNTADISALGAIKALQDIVAIQSDFDYQGIIVSFSFWFCLGRLQVRQDTMTNVILASVIHQGLWNTHNGTAEVLTCDNCWLTLAHFICQLSVLWLELCASKSLGRNIQMLCQVNHLMGFLQVVGHSWGSVATRTWSNFRIHLQAFTNRAWQYPSLE